MQARFWRNVTLIALAHIALVVLSLRWAGETKAASAPEITWLSGGAETETSETAEATTSVLTPQPDETKPPVPSDIVLRDETPTLTPKPLPTATPPPTPKPAAKPTTTPQATAKKPKPSPAPVKKKAGASPARAGAGKTGGARKPTAGNAKTSTGGSGDGASGTGSGKSDAATANYYGNMLHDRFYRAWEQPQTVVASGVKLSAVARIRIEKDGRVSDFKIVKPSGNVLVDESVQSVSHKVTQVDALPAAIGSGGHYDVNVNFALNSE